MLKSLINRNHFSIFFFFFISFLKVWRNLTYLTKWQLNLCLNHIKLTIPQLNSQLANPSTTRHVQFLRKTIVFLNALFPAFLFHDLSDLSAAKSKGLFLSCSKIPGTRNKKRTRSATDSLKRVFSKHYYAENNYRIIFGCKRCILFDTRALFRCPVRWC